ncbi:hypothetical protein Tco_1459955, partial [Tanacetum coccineum]
EAVNEEMDASLEKAATTATSLDVDSGSGPRCQESMGDTIAHTRSENVSKLSNDPLLARGNTLRSGEDSLKLEELMALCTTLQQRVLDLETTKTTQGNEIASLRRRVKKLENKDRKRTHGLKRLYKVGLSRRVESSEDEVHRDEDMFGVNDLDGDEVVVETEVAHEVVVETEVDSKDVNLSVDEVALAQALAALKSAKPRADKVVIQEQEPGTITTTTTATTLTAASTRPKVKGLVIHEEEQATTPTVSSQQPSQVKVQDKDKAIMVEEPVKPKKKVQIMLYKEDAKKLQDAFDGEEILARERYQKEQEANVALTKE